jgi:hypothetical protein
MLRATLPILLLLSGLVLGSCAVASVDDETVADTEDAITLQGNLPGTWRAEDHIARRSKLIVLKTDGTYHSETQLACGPGACPPLAQDGRYRVYGNRRVSYLALFSDGARQVERYQYILGRGELLLRSVAPGGEWHTLLRATPAWCGVPRDCTLQDLPASPALSFWRCEQDACALGYVRMPNDSTIPQPIAEE